MRLQNKKTLFWAFSIVVVATCALVWYLLQITQKDHATWTHLQKSAKPKHKISTSCHQERKNVCKQIHLPNGYLQIASERSQIEMEIEKKSVSIVETFEKVSVIVRQQEVEHHLEAPWATFNYSTKKLVIRDIHLETFESTKRKSALRASHATYEDGCLTVEGGVRYLDYEGQLSISSGRAELLFTDALEQVHLMGNVLLQQGHARYIKAPEVTYFPDEDKMHVVGGKEGVYFFDTQQKTQLRASQIWGSHLRDPEKMRLKTTDAVRVVLQGEWLAQFKE